MKNVLACIDGSVYTPSVCQHAAWAALRLDAPLEFLHALDRHPETAATRDLSGNIGVHAQDGLLEELATLDEQRSKLAQRRGRQLLDSAVRHAQGFGVPDVGQRLRHGALVDTLSDIEADVRLFVLGKRGEHADFAKLHLGGELERVVRAVHRPVLVASRAFQPIRRIAIAYDGSPTAQKAVDMVARSPLFKGMPCHVVTAGADDGVSRSRQRPARESLEQAGFEVSTSIRRGAPETAIADTVKAEAIDVLVMGAYGHTRIRQFIIGSTTTATLRSCTIPVLLLR